MDIKNVSTRAYGKPLLNGFNLMAKLNRFNEATLEAAKAAALFGLLYPLERATTLFKKKFGKLPCGKSQRSRMVKKRNKKIFDWYFNGGKDDPYDVNETLTQKDVDKILRCEN